MSLFIRALWDPAVVGLDSIKQRGQVARQRKRMSRRPVGVSAPGLPGQRSSSALGLRHAVSSGMGLGLRLGKLGRVRKAFLYLEFFSVGTSGLEYRSELS